MSVPIECKKCGYRGIAPGIKISNSTNITFVGSTTTCPQCGSSAEIQDGTYDFVGSVLSAIRAPGMTLARIEAVRAAATDVQAGRLAQDEAAAMIQRFGGAISTVWDAATRNSGGLSVLIAILVLFLSYRAYQSANDSSTQQHQDALNQLRATERQTEAIQPSKQADRNWQEVQQAIYDALQRQFSGGVPQISPLQSTTPKPKPSQAQTLNQAERGANRHQRRISAKHAEKRPKS